jgi:hypothetical protein
MRILFPFKERMFDSIHRYIGRVTVLKEHFIVASCRIAGFEAVKETYIELDY